MYERFTDRAIKIMQFANQEAQRLNHEHFGTEHILLGLLKEGTGCGARVLEKLGIALPDVRLEVEKLVQRGPDMVRLGKLPQTPRAKKVIEYAMEEARALHHNYVGTEHLLLGMLRKTDCTASYVLTKECGLTLAQVREEVVRLTSAEAKPDTTADDPQQLQAGQVLLDLLHDAGASAEEVAIMLGLLSRPLLSQSTENDTQSTFFSRQMIRNQIVGPLQRLLTDQQNLAQSKEPTNHSS